MTTKSAHSVRRPQRGFALPMVMGMAVGVSMLAVFFGSSVVLEYTAAANALAGAQADQAIESARRYLLSYLSTAADKGELPDPEDYQNEAVPVDPDASYTAYFWLLGRETDGEKQTAPVFGLVDEASKINLNSAGRDMLLELPGMTEELAAAIMDWRDEDDDPEDGGAESETYLRRDPKYYCKNASFETVAELMWVYGADWDILWGRDRNLNGFLDTWEGDDSELASSSSDFSADFGLFEYVTVYSREPNTTEDGEERAYLNDSDTDTLSTYLEEQLGEQRASEAMEQAGVGDRTFTSVLEFYLYSGLTREEFDPIANGLTVSEDEYIDGLININTASATVLACIPGIGAENADAVVSYRSRSEEDLGSVAWLTEVLDSDEAVEAGPYVTTLSYQFSADVAAVAGNGRGYRRTLFIIDTNGDQPEVVHRRDYAHLGWALGEDVREDF